MKNTLPVVDSATLPITQKFYHFTATAGQTTFSGLDDDSDTLAYTAGALAIYLNGILLVDSADYTASNGTSITLTDASEFPTSGYIVIEKVNSTSGAYENETIQYTGKSTNDLTGCTRGTAAPYRGATPPATTAGTHASGAKVYGSYLATAIATTVVVGPKASQTETLYNSLTVPLVSNATTAVTGGGFQCTIGPVNDRG